MVNILKKISCQSNVPIFFNGTIIVQINFVNTIICMCIFILSVKCRKKWQTFDIVY